MKINNKEITNEVQLELFEKIKTQLKAKHDLAGTRVANRYLLDLLIDFIQAGGKTLHSWTSAEGNDLAMGLMNRKFITKPSLSEIIKCDLAKCDEKTQAKVLYIALYTYDRTLFMRILKDLSFEKISALKDKKGKGIVSGYLAFVKDLHVMSFDVTEKEGIYWILANRNSVLDDFKKKKEIVSLVGWGFEPGELAQVISEPETIQEDGTNKNIKDAEMLLDRGDNPTEWASYAPDGSLEANLNAAIKRGKSEKFVRLLLDYGADPFARDPSTGNTALHLAAASDEPVDYVKLIFDAGWDMEELIDATNDMGIRFMDILIESFAKRSVPEEVTEFKAKHLQNLISGGAFERYDFTPTPTTTSTYHSFSPHGYRTGAQSDPDMTTNQKDEVIKGKLLPTKKQ